MEIVKWFYLEKHNLIVFKKRDMLPAQEGWSIISFFSLLLIVAVRMGGMLVSMNGSLG